MDDANERSELIVAVANHEVAAKRIKNQIPRARSTAQQIESTKYSAANRISRTHQMRFDAFALYANCPSLS